MLPISETNHLLSKYNTNEKTFIELEDQDCSEMIIKNENLNTDLIYTFNLHGKSRFYGLWRLNELLKSNFQLNEIENIRNNSKYVIPVKSLAETLASRVLIIY
jgi:hypothetical protein